jgi:hypothetical protein
VVFFSYLEVDMPSDALSDSGQMAQPVPSLEKVISETIEHINSYFGDFVSIEINNLLETEVLIADEYQKIKNEVLDLILKVTGAYRKMQAKVIVYIHKFRRVQDEKDFPGSTLEGQYIGLSMRRVLPSSKENDTGLVKTVLFPRLVA